MPVRAVKVVSRSYLREAGIEVPEDRIQPLAEEGKTVVFLLADEQPLGAIPLAAGVLYWAGILLPPAVGALVMSVSTVVVAINARLLGRAEERLSGRGATPQSDTASADD